MVNFRIEAPSWLSIDFLANGLETVGGLKYMPARARNAIGKPISLSEETVAGLSPDTEETLLEDLAAATQDRGWGKVKGLNEKNLFDTQYNQIKQSVYREAGVTALKLYDKYKDLVEAAVLLFSGPDKADENFLGM